jgi:hypothetical protein
MDEKGVRVKTTQPFKLKDKDGRRFVVIKLKEQFGFTPESIIIEKVQGHHNTLVVRAVMTEEAIKEEQERKLKLQQ